jgi:hypothetical protein
LSILTETVIGAVLLLTAAIWHVDPDSILSILKEASSALRTGGAGAAQTSAIEINKKFLNGNPHFMQETGSERGRKQRRTRMVMFDYAMSIQFRQA